jgi:hypothetical protein
MAIRSTFPISRDTDPRRIGMRAAYTRHQTGRHDNAVSVGGVLAPRSDLGLIERDGEHCAVGSATQDVTIVALTRIAVYCIDLETRYPPALVTSSHLDLGAWRQVTGPVVSKDRHPVSPRSPHPPRLDRATGTPHVQRGASTSGGNILSGPRSTHVPGDGRARPGVAPFGVPRHFIGV